MSGSGTANPWQTDGKFFRSGDSRIWLRAVTYGPFPGGWPEELGRDFKRIAAAGFNALRLFEMPDRRLLDAAAHHGLRVFGGLMWGQNADFFRLPALMSTARVALVESLRTVDDHAALAGVFVANEIPTDLVRWMGPERTRRAIEDLIALGRSTAPHLMFAYANYPSTEYLEPENADFTAFNIYLEDESSYRRYIKRLHHIAGDRPLVISEFGLDSQRNGLERQAEMLRWAMVAAHEEECAGMAIYAWSDRWWNAGAEVMDWDFGLIDRNGVAKPALATVSCELPPCRDVAPCSVIVCTRNGRSRIAACLHALARQREGLLETIVVDDGSQDGTADFVATRFPWVKLLRLDPCGLSAARNAGAAAASGEILAFTDDDCEPDSEWLQRLGRVFAKGRHSAAGGPNLPPPPRNWQEAVVCASSGAPSHVMLDDEEAEHLPGCSLAVTRAAFDAIGGFDERFETAGDDVDFCWRLRSAGFRLGFAPGSFVWHRRRPSIRAFLRQQWGYGLAERLLTVKHPEKFSKRGGARWQGFIYAGGPLRAKADSVIYHGLMGRAGYQSGIDRMLPTRGIASAYKGWRSRLGLRLVEFLAPRIRAWARNRTILLDLTDSTIRKTRLATEWAIPGVSRDEILVRLAEDGWKACGPTGAWDMEKNGSLLLLATERGDHGLKNTLVRLHGKSSTVPAWLRSASVVDSV